MDISLLKTFLEVARVRHFGKAAERLFITQSAVSARIKLLEERLDQVLFERKRNDIRLTEAGERLLRHAEGVVRAWERARQDMAMGQEYAETLRVGVILDLWRLWVGAWSARVQKQSHGTAFRFEIAPRDNLVERLMTGTLDAVFVIEPPQQGGLVQRQILSIPLVMVATRPGLDAGSIAAAGYWYVDWGLSFGISHEAIFSGAEVSRYSVSAGEPALHFLLEYGGVAYLPRQWVAPLIADGRLYEVAGVPEVERFGFAAWRPDSRRASLIEKFLQQ